MTASSSVGEWLAMLALTYLCHSTALIGIAWLAIKASRVRSHALAERVWKLAVVLGLATTALQLATGASRPLAVFVFEPLGAPTAADEHHAVSKTMSLAEESPAAWRLVAVGSDRLESGEVPETEGRLSEKADARNSANQLADTLRVSPKGDGATTGRFSYTAVLGLLTAAWMAMAAAWLAAKTWRFNRFLGRMQVISSGPARRRLDRLRNRHGFRRDVRLLTSPACGTPLACGLLRPTIILPKGAEQRLRGDELDALLAHELAHLARSDVRWLLVGRVLTWCFAFQPLNRLAVRGWRRAAECLCDDWAVERLGSPLALARCLTQVAGWGLTNRTPALAVAVGGSAGSLVERVERLVAGAAGNDPWSSRPRGTCVAVAAASLAAAVAYWAPRAACSTPFAMSSEQSPAQAGKRDFDQPRQGETLRQSRFESADWRSLQSEWSELRSDLQHVESLMGPFQTQKEIRRAADRVRDRAEAIQGRLNDLTQGFKNERTFKEE